ncbi:MAG: 2-octaprenyl-6-methoxyphenyl hydroxylase [Xanthomonadales bacterium]|nr:2-octaprenyl-6-methoxyphenyl hydroxylase [Xanthomonadales bacterium]
MSESENHDVSVPCASFVDVAIVGAGLVGASLACALDALGLRTLLVEASAGGTQPAPSFDERNLALGKASVNALASLGVWRHIRTAPEAIRRVHVSSRGDFGSVLLAATDHGLDAFGAVVIARELGAALEARLDELKHLQRLRPARVSAVTSSAEAATLCIESPGGEIREVRTRLLVAADGSHSAIRESLGIAAKHHDYRQRLFVATATAEREHQGGAWERFTPDGPVAVLPLGGGRLGSICTVAAEQADAVAALDDDAYRELLQSRFGYRLGRINRVGKRSHYPLALIKSEQLVAERTVLVGNAAQTLHPIGAQGFNLGLRDALTLAEVLETALGQGREPGQIDDLREYARRREPDREETLRFSDGLSRLFAITDPAVRLARSLGFGALNGIPGLAERLAAGAMGFRGDVPRLALGAAVAERSA